LLPTPYFSDTPSVDSGVTRAQLFVGQKSLVADVYGLKRDKLFVKTLEDNIHKRGATDKLISDCAKAEMIERVKQILCVLFIRAWHSAPYHEKQSFAENRYATIMATTNLVLNFPSAPVDTWLLALMYLCLLLNQLASAALGWKIPMQALTGKTPNIFVYYHLYSDMFPSTSNEEQDWWVGVATHVGNEFEYKILTQKQRLIYRSAIRSARSHVKQNQCLSPLGGETVSN
jgi:hypothetical protein